MWAKTTMGVLPFNLATSFSSHSSCSWPRLPSPPALEFQPVDKADKMRSLLVEAVPAVALGPLAETLVEHRAVVVEHIVLAGNVKDALGLQALQRFSERVEFLRL